MATEESGDMEPQELISGSIRSYLQSRQLILSVFAGISGTQATGQSVSQELQGLVNRMYRVIGDEIQSYMHGSKVKQIVDTFRGNVIQP